MIRINTDHLGKDFMRVSPWDDAFIEWPSDPGKEGSAEEQEVYIAAMKARGEAFEQFHESGLESFLEPYAIPGKTPVVFRLRHLRGLIEQELGDVLRPTFGPRKEVTDSTYAALAALAIAKVENWTGPPKLKWIKHERYLWDVLHPDSFAVLCTAGPLVRYLGRQALEAFELRPLS